MFQMVHKVGQSLAKQVRAGVGSWTPLGQGKLYCWVAQGLGCGNKEGQEIFRVQGSGCFQASTEDLTL